MKKKLLSLLTSLMLAASLLSFVPQNSVSAHSDSTSAITEQQSAFSIVSSDELGTLISIPDEEDQAQSSDQGVLTLEVNDSASQAFITRSRTTYGYKFLASCSKAKMRQQYYNDLFTICCNFWDQTLDHTYLKFQDLYIIAKPDFSQYGLTYTEAIETYATMRNDNPQFYFLPTTVAYTSRYLDLLLDPSYYSKATRKSLQNRIVSYVNNAAALVKDNYTNYYKALVFNNYLCSNVEYARDSSGRADTSQWAHNIVGPIMYKSGVCEAYAKLYQLLLNYVGVENIYIVGQGRTSRHAWNLVKLDNGYYYGYDTTWNDSARTTSYIARGTTYFNQHHTADTPSYPSGRPLRFLYSLPALPAADYNGTREQYKTASGDFTKKLSNFSADDVSYTAVTLSWDRPAIASGVYIYKFNGSTGKYDKIAKLANNVSTYTVSGLEPNKSYTLRAATYYVYNGKELVSATPSQIGVKTLALPKNMPQIVRYAGTDRFGTAAEISNGMGGESEYVVIASGLSYADALAGVPLAKALNAPILLTDGKVLTDKTKSEIKRLGAKKALILGGTGVVANSVKTSLRKLGLTVERLSGTNRFETATKIAARLEQVTGEKPTNAFFVYSNGFADALSVSTVAALKNAPIFYIAANGQLDKYTSQYLAKSDSKLEVSYIIGGPKLIGYTAETSVRKYSTISMRIYGKDRFETCEKVNFIYFSYDLRGTTPCVATGFNYPDALAGGVLAANNSSPIILAGTKIPDTLKTRLNNKEVSMLYVLGGTGAVSTDVVYQIAGACTKRPAQDDSAA